MNINISLKLFSFLFLFFLIGIIKTSAQENKTTKQSSYTYDPYYEESSPHKEKSYGNYQIREREFDERFSIEAYEKIATSYVWRNVTRNDEPVSETGFVLLVSKFAFSIMAFMDLTDYGVAVGYGNQSFEISELDASFSYEDKWQDISYKVELKHYLFPNKYTPIKAKGRLTNDSTTEFNILIGYDIFLKPSLLISYDIDEVSDFYLELGACHSFTKEFWEIPTRINIGGGLGIGSAGFNDYNFGVDSFAMTGITLRANWEWMFKENMILTPELGVAFPLDSKISDAMDKASKIQSSPTTVFFALKFVFKL